MTQDQALVVLRSAGLRLTEPRRKILDVLIAASEPITADDIHARFGAEADLSTVYRNLLAFVEAGLIDSRPGASGEKRYEVKSQSANGARWMCLDCGKFLPLPEADLVSIGTAAARQGFDPHTLTLAAHCVHTCEK